METKVHKIVKAGARQPPPISKKQQLLDERRRLMRRLKEIEKEMKEA